MKFNSILIGSEDPKRLAEYYTKLFGEPAMSDGTYTGWKIGEGFVAVGPHDQVKGPNAQPGRIIWNIESADVKGDFAKLEAAGAKVVRAVQSWRSTHLDSDVCGSRRQLLSDHDGDVVLRLRCLA